MWLKKPRFFYLKSDLDTPTHINMHCYIYMWIWFARNLIQTTICFYIIKAQAFPRNYFQWLSEFGYVKWVWHKIWHTCAVRKDFTFSQQFYTSSNFTATLVIFFCVMCLFRKMHSPCNLKYTSILLIKMLKPGYSHILNESITLHARRESSVFIHFA